MQIIRDPREMQALCGGWRCGGETIGFVPTMGALHRGHAELCRLARAGNTRFCASIFVNPTQFAAHEDLNRYPRPFEDDCALLQQAGCDAVFAPTPAAMWGAHDLKHGTWVEVAPLDEMWEGVTRPGHLRGVATVVAKLFNISSPDRAYFGEKDYQQLKVVESIVRDLNFPLHVVPVPTVREADGLALSSRNRYLASDERRAAAQIYRALQSGAILAREGERDVTRLGVAMQAVLEAEPLLKLQYLTIVEAQTLQPLSMLDGQPARILVAAHVGKTRLIDNLAVN